MSRSTRVFLVCPIHGARAVENASLHVAHCAQLPRHEWPEGVSNHERRVARCEECIRHMAHYPDARALWYRARTVHHNDLGEHATKCGARCRSAKRRDCDCVCRGEFHAAGS